MDFLQFLQASFFLFIISLIFFLKFKPFCNCKICHSYITSNWTNNFLNLSDWFTFLLKNSPSKTIRIHVLNNIITSNPHNIEHILKSKFENYPKGKNFSLILGDFLGRGIFNVDGEPWRFQRKMASLELDRVSIRNYAFEIVKNEVEIRLVPLLFSFVGKSYPILDLQDVFRRLCFDTVCKFSFGLDPMCLELNLPMSEFAISFDQASKLSAERALTFCSWIWKIKRTMNIGSEKNLRKSLSTINKLALEVIRHKRKMGFLSQNDLLSRFMSSIDDDKYLRDIVISFLLAGRDTMASALTSFFMLLTNHADVEATIRAEADRVLGRNQELKTFDQIGDLHYLHASVYESMRIFPPVQFDSKFCKEDDVLPDGTVVKGGTRVTYHAYAMGRDEEIWGSDCLEFKPERWLKDGKFFQEISAFKYPVFQGGIRVCLGKEMAIVELKCVVLSLVRLYDIRLATPNRSPRFSTGLTATFSEGLPVIVSKRTNVS